MIFFGFIGVFYFISTCSFASARRSFCAAPNPLFDRQPCNTSPEDNIFVQERLQISRFKENRKFIITLRLSCLEYDLRVATGALVNERQVISGGVAEPANLFWIKNIYCCLFKSLFNLSTHFFTSFSKTVGISTDSCESFTAAEMGFNLYPNIKQK